MLTDRVLLIGTSAVSHPVTDDLFGGLLAPGPAEIGPLDRYLLVVVDARLSSSGLEEDGIAQKALRAGVALLILGPAEGQLAPLAAVLGAVPDVPAQAVFVCRSSNAGEEHRFEATALAYGPTPGRDGLAHADDSNQAAQAKAEHVEPDEPAGGTRDGAAGSRQETAVGAFTTFLQSRLTSGYAPAPVNLPDGLKFFRVPWNFMSGFSSQGTGQDSVSYRNGPGRITASLVIWGFLNQTKTSNAQYLVVEASYDVDPGRLAQSDDEGRGFASTLLVGNTRPVPPQFAPVGHVPTNGVNSWDETLKIDISYQDPATEGYQLYTFTSTVNQTITDWSVQNEGSGTVLGAEWFMNAPANGADLQSTYKNAFTLWGGVKSLPSASTGTLNAREASAWITNTVLKGRIGISVQLETQQTIFYSFRCGLAICYRIAVLALPGFRASQTVSVDLSPIQP
ncbi:MAG TPA: hypothetical protein VF432_04435 [Thermoanaerobaculia bacterium]